ncbi:hypothetical protein [Brevundimonas sp.]|uniref:hypothetical protein n=1 Tax=Brevundimonas sp. TaxID=1871086 RepID=UPI001DE63556|nr:hypothetical protein [Brevundimonas sp.]MBL0946774.1 hypothetical protein [Brevundimonas sp.]
MTHAAPSPSPAPDDVWTVAREAYLAGSTAAMVCRELALSPSTFWQRAAREGWLRRDHPRRADTLPPLAPVNLDDPVDDLWTALDKVWHRICAALDAGDAAGAVRWTRVHAQLKATATAENQARAAERRRAAHQQSLDALRESEAIVRAAEAQLAALHAQQAVSEVEKVESVLRDSTPPPAQQPQPPLNRAQRRRLQKRGSGP